jgi:hypothetical protein
MGVAVNYWAIIVSAIASIVLGFLWYGAWFGKMWVHLSGTSMPKKMSPGHRVVQILAPLVMAWVLAHSLIFASEFLGFTGVQAGLTAGFYNWLGFIAPVLVGKVLWEGKSWKQWFIEAGYYLVALLIMGAILAVWR